MLGALHWSRGAPVVLGPTCRSVPAVYVVRCFRALLVVLWCLMLALGGRVGGVALSFGVWFRGLGASGVVSRLSHCGLASAVCVKRFGGLSPFRWVCRGRLLAFVMLCYFRPDGPWPPMT